MSTNMISLKELERKAFRSTYQDGLWDIYQGGIISSFTVFAGALDTSDHLTSWQRMIIFLAGIGISYLIFWAGKKFITLPRIGQVKFGPARQRRKRTLFAVMSGIVGLQVVILAFTVALWQIPALRSWFGFLAMPQSMETLVVAVVGALFVGPSLALVAYFNDFTRGYYIAAVMSIAVFCLIWFESALLMLVAGALVILPGVFFFIRFLIQHPLHPQEMRND
jgi:MFS family permease